MVNLQMGNKSSGKSSKQNNIVLYIGIVLFVLFTILISRLFFSSGGEDKAYANIVQVGKESFKLQVVERGLVKPARITPIKSHISGNQAKLIWVLDEGIKINKDLLVARFDTKPLMDIMEIAQQQLVDARAQLEVSFKALELLKESAKSKIEAVQRKLEIAKIKSNDLKNGSGPLKRRQHEYVVQKLIRISHLEAKEVEDLEPLLEKGHITSREYEKAQNESIAAQESLEIARAELDNFDKYEWPRIVREAEVIIDAAVMELARVQRTNELERQQLVSKVEKNRRDLEVKRKNFAKAKKEVAACDVYSPTNGILLYSRIPYLEKKRKIQIGDSVWNGQTFLEVPDTSDLVVEINVREIEVAKLAPGMPAEIVLDAYPDQIFNGTMISIDALAQEDDNNSSIRRFFAKIRINDATSAIHVGMSASVKIVYKELNDVLAVPTSAISYRDGQAFVEKSFADSVMSVEVELGYSGIKWVQIRSGLSENDSILMDSF